MFIRLNSSLQTKNLMGLSDEALAMGSLDPYYNFIRFGDAELKAGKGGEVLILQADFNLNIHRDYQVLCQPHPDLHHFGIVSYNPILSGECQPEFIVRAHRAGELALDYLMELRLIGS